MWRLARSRARRGPHISVYSSGRRSRRNAAQNGSCLARLQTLPLTFISSCLSESVTWVGGGSPSSPSRVIRLHKWPHVCPAPVPRIHNTSYHVRVRISVASEPQRPLCVSVMSGDSASSHVFCCFVCTRGHVCVWPCLP